MSRASCAQRPDSRRPAHWKEIRCTRSSDQSELTRSILSTIHEEELRHCGGIELLMGQVRLHYWVVHLRKMAKDTIANCQWCQRRNPYSLKRKPPPLNWTRFGNSKDLRAFCHVGINMAGPWHTKQGRGRPRLKRWLIVFTCCVTRAINCEMVYDQNAHSLGLAFSRHCILFGEPSTVNSDNGGNLVRVRHQAKEMWEIWAQDRPYFQARWPKIQWWHNPP